VRVPALPDIEFLSRVCVPVRSQGLLFGFLWIIDEDESLSDDDLGAAVEAASGAGEVLYREQLLDDLRDSRERELFRDLLSDDAAISAAAAALLVEEELLPPSCYVSVLEIRVDAVEREDLRTALDAVLRRAGRRANPMLSLSLSRAGGRGVLLLASRRRPALKDLRTVAESVSDDLAKQLNGDTIVRVGIGPALEGAAQSPSSARRARESLDVAAKVPGFATITSWDELGVYRLLVQLPLDDLPEDAIPPGLLALMQADGEGPLIETLETWLDEGCDSRHTVARLQVHRTSLYYRLGRIEEITGMPLSDGNARLDLHLGLKLARLKGVLGR
jgi:hypothetical protein